MAGRPGCGPDPLGALTGHGGGRLTGWWAAADGDTEAGPAPPLCWPPTNGDEAAAASSALVAAVKAGLGPSRVLIAGSGPPPPTRVPHRFETLANGATGARVWRLLWQLLCRHSGSYWRPAPPAPTPHLTIQRSLGTRLRYCEWPGPAGSPTLVLLHDGGEAGAVWAGVAAALAGHVAVVAPDLRGHGGTPPSPAGRYSATDLADDVLDLIIAHDWYTMPLALAGAGVGAAVATALAARAPALVGALALLGVDGPQAAQAFVPWQAGVFNDWQHAAACLASRDWGPACMSPKAASRAAAALLVPDRRSGGLRMAVNDRWFFPQGGLAWLEGRQGGEEGDPGKGDAQRASFDRLPSSLVHVLLLRGERDGTTCSAAHATYTASLSPSAVAITLPAVRRALALEAHDAVADALAAWLARAAAGGAFSSGAGLRTPERLGLRPLPSYASPAQAAKALLRRPPPAAEVVEAELAKLREEEGRGGGDSSDDDACSGGGQRTALARDPPTYFGFCG